MPLVLADANGKVGSAEAIRPAFADEESSYGCHFHKFVLAEKLGVPSTWLERAEVNLQHTSKSTNGGRRRVVFVPIDANFPVPLGQAFVLIVVDLLVPRIDHLPAAFDTPAVAPPPPMPAPSTTAPMTPPQPRTTTRDPVGESSKSEGEGEGEKHAANSAAAHTETGRTTRTRPRITPLVAMTDLEVSADRHLWDLLFSSNVHTSSCAASTTLTCTRGTGEGAKTPPSATTRVPPQAHAPPGTEDSHEETQRPDW
jgi:hypothetical protein